MHTIICGTTGTGKTTLALILAREARKRKIMSMVYDRRDAGYCCDIVVKSFERFLQIAQASSNMMLFVDDCPTVLKRGVPAHKWLTTESRHQGHNVILISQRYMMIPKDNRDNCQTVWMFRQSARDCKEIADEFGYDFRDLRPGNAPMEKLHFLKITPDGIKSGSVDPVSGNVYMNFKG